MEMYGLRHVNWLCLDVEGAEILVLRTLDFTVDFFQVEKNGHDQEILKIFLNHTVTDSTSHVLMHTRKPSI